MLCHPPTPFHPADSIHHPSSSNLHLPSFIAWPVSDSKNTICVLERTSQPWRRFTIYGLISPWSTKNVSTSLTDALRAILGFLRDFSLQNTVQIDSNFTPNTTHPTSCWTNSWLRAIVLSRKFIFSHDKSISRTFWRLFLCRKFCEGTDPRKKRTSPRVSFFDLSVKPKIWKNNDEIVHNVYYV